MRTRKAKRLEATMPDLTERVASAKGELVRVEAKAGILASLSGAALTVLLATTGQRPTVAAAATGWVAVGMFAASTMLLLWALRPALGGRAYGVVRTAQLTAASVLDDALTRAGDLDQSATERATEAARLSMLATRKYRWIRGAVDLALSGVLVAAAAVVLTALGK